jgi:hypothetical protein
MKNLQELYQALIEYHATILFNKEEPSHAYFNEEVYRKYCGFDDNEIIDDIIATYRKWVAEER